MSGVSNALLGSRVRAAALTASTAILAGGLAAIQPVVVAGAGATVILTWCLAALPPLLLAVAVHKGVWNVAPVIELIGQEAPTVALIGLTAVLMAARSARRPAPASLVRLGLFTAVFVTYGAVGAVLGDGLDSTAKVLRMALFFGWGFLLAGLVGIDRRATIVALGSVVGGAILIAAASTGNWIAAGVPTVFGENHINFGRSVGVGAVVALGAALTGRLRPGWRLLSIAVGVALSIVTVASGSRGAFISLGAAGVAMLFLPVAGRGIRSRLVALVLLMGVAVVALLAASGSVGFERLLSLGSPGDDVPALLRAQAIQISFDQWLSSPLFGIGLRDLQVPVSVGTFADVLTYPHNIIMETLSQTGLVGLILLLAGIAVPLGVVATYTRLRTDPVVAVLVGAFIFYFVSAQFSGDLQINRYVWTFAFFLTATPAWLEDHS